MDLPLVDGSYKWADGKSVGIYDSTIVAVHTDHPNGIVGYVIKNYLQSSGFKNKVFRDKSDFKI